ncbi:BQ2448_7489 [Microbotryum intermedium]|uniref:BQ2448_7489 protein n=1 Tax=Microbotryum intermedium TaxID=269621 RepID=A0A238FNI6_9BASI|nr:BQ2448_7489 [Microbotryum intermedium]
MRRGADTSPGVARRSPWKGMTLACRARRSGFNAPPTTTTSSRYHNRLTSRRVIELAS